MGSLERAIQKLQQSAKERPPTAPIPTAPYPGRPVLRGFDPATLQPRHSVATDRQALQKSGLVSPREHETLIFEQFRSIKRPLIANAFGRGADAGPLDNLVLVTSAVQGEGKSFCSFNLALSLAREKDRPVLLIDADVAKPHLSRALGAESAAGLLDAASDEGCEPAELIMGTGTPGLYFLPCGAADASANEILASTRMEALMMALAEQFRGIVVIDSPPLLQTNEAAVLLNLVGQVVLVVASGRTLQASVLEAVGQIPEDKALNLVLNGVSGRGRKYGYGSAYHGQV